MRKLNEQISSLEDAFNTKLLAATKDGAYATGDKAALAGLSEAQIAGAAQMAKDRKVEGFVVPLQNTTQQPDLASLSNRSTRQAMFEHSWNRAERATPTIRATPCASGAASGAEGQAARLCEFRGVDARQSDGQDARGRVAVHGCDRSGGDGTGGSGGGGHPGRDRFPEGRLSGTSLRLGFLREQVRKARYDIDDEQVKPYFELDSVLKNGVFYAATQLYGITFKERHDLRSTRPMCAC